MSVVRGTIDEIAAFWGPGSRRILISECIDRHSCFFAFDVEAPDVEIARKLVRVLFRTLFAIIFGGCGCGFGGGGGDGGGAGRRGFLPFEPHSLVASPNSSSDPSSLGSPSLCSSSSSATFLAFAFFFSLGGCGSGGGE